MHVKGKGSIGPRYCNYEMLTCFPRNHQSQERARLMISVLHVIALNNDACNVMFCDDGDCDDGVLSPPCYCFLLSGEASGIQNQNGI